VESGLVKSNQIDDLMKENDELFKIIASNIVTMKKIINSKKDSFGNKL
jgi:hypothetical protein